MGDSQSGKADDLSESGCWWRCNMRMSLPTRCLWYAFCKMREGAWDFPQLLRITAVGLRSWERQSPLVKTRPVKDCATPGLLVQQKCSSGWVAVDFYRRKIYPDSTDWLHIGIDRSQTEHDMLFSSSSSWPNRLIFCNCSFSFGIIKTQPK